MGNFNFKILLFKVSFCLQYVLWSGTDSLDINVEIGGDILLSAILLDHYLYFAVCFYLTVWSWLIFFLIEFIDGKIIFLYEVLLAGLSSTDRLLHISESVALLYFLHEFQIVLSKCPNNILQSPLSLRPISFLFHISCIAK